MKIQKKPIGHFSLGDRKTVGAHYTPRVLAEFVARRISEAWSGKTGKIRLLDPAVGDGELIFWMLRELTQQGHADIDAFGFDTDPDAVQFATDRIKTAFPKISLSLKQDDFLDFALAHKTDTLFLSNFKSFDLAIANPPYVRTQVMGAKKARVLSRQFGLSGRVDLYYAFILGIAEVMQPKGVIGIIVSNRFMTTRSGASVRRHIIEKFDILHVWDMGDTKVFEAAVLPSVLLMKRKGRRHRSTVPEFTSVYSTPHTPSARKCENIMASLNESGPVKVDGQCYIVRKGKLDHEGKMDGIWRMSTDASDQWFDMLKAHTYCTFGDVGKVRVGVKTTADKVFIRSDWNEMPEKERPELLRPLMTHRVARRFKATRSEKPEMILYPHQVREGKRVPVNMDEYPNALRYLNRHRSVLEAREYVSKAGRKWFEIWVPHRPDAWDRPKIVFRDISEKPMFWMELSGSVVNGDCYWLACENPQHTHLLWLALAIGNSSFTEMFYDRMFNNKLYAGRRRFITQYVEKFPLPDPKSEGSKSLIELAERIYHLMPSPETESLERKLDQLVWDAFGLASQKSH